MKEVQTIVPSDTEGVTIPNEWRRMVKRQSPRRYRQEWTSGGATSTDYQY